MEKDKTPGILKPFKTFIFSIISFSYYKELFKKPVWHAVLYLFVVAFIFGSIAFLPTINDTIDLYDEISTAILEKTPSFSVNEGILESDSNEAFTIFNDTEADAIIILDSENQLELTDYRDYSIALILQKDNVLIQFIGTNINYSYDDVLIYFSDDTINNASVGLLIELVSKFSILALIVYALIFTFMIFFGALFIMVVGRIMILLRSGINMKIGKAFSIACYSSTLPILFVTAIFLLNTYISTYQWIYVFIGLLYYYNAIRYIVPKREKKSEE